MRHFNYTGRLRISRSDVSIALHASDDGTREFEAVLDLAAIRRHAPGNSAVFVEAYGGTKFERFAFGTLASPAPAARHRLATFGADENVLFRVKVVETDVTRGRIIAMATRIRPAGPGETQQASLLPVSVAKLEGVVYRVDFPDDGPPTLVLNEELEAGLPQGIKAIARTPMFVSLVLPEVVRQILTRILVVDCHTDDDDDDSSHAAKWKRFARVRNREPIPQLDDGDEPGPLLDWIDVAVARIAQDLRTLQRFRQGAEKL